MRNQRLIIVSLATLLILATAAAYWSVFFCDFISLDDTEYVYKNPHVLAGLSWSGVRYAFTTLDATNWHPLTWLSLELDGSLWHRNPAGYHATSLVLHLANTLLVFAVWRRLTDDSFCSAAVAGLFALHPLHVESVAWVSERKDVLSTFFLLLTLLAYIRYAAGPTMPRYLAVTALFILGLLAKPMLVTAPILLLLVDVWPLERIAADGPLHSPARFPPRTWRKLLLEKTPWLLLAFADGLMTLVAQAGAVKAMIDVTLGIRLANVFNALFWYLQKTFVPTRLSLFYPHPEQNVSGVSVSVGLLLCIAITVWAVVRRKQSPHLLFGWAWFCISLLPVIGLIQVGPQAYADRYVYIPHLGLFTAIVWELRSWFAGTAVGRVVAGTILSAAIVGCGIMTHYQSAYWKNSETIWTRALEINPENGYAHAHLSDVFVEKQEYERAIEHIQAGLRMRRAGYYANAYANWGLCLVKLNKPAEAEEKFLAALKIDPNQPWALDELSKLLAKQGRTAEASHYADRLATTQEQQVAKQADSPAAQMMLGRAEAQRGNLPQAKTHFEKAVQLAPESAEALSNLALLEMQLKQFDQAITHFTKALELKPELAVAHLCLADIYERKNNLPAAKTHLSEALRLSPSDERIKRRWEQLSRK